MLAAVEKPTAVEAKSHLDMTHPLGASGRLFIGDAGCSWPMRLVAVIAACPSGQSMHCCVFNLCFMGLPQNLGRDTTGTSNLHHAHKTRA